MKENFAHSLKLLLRSEGGNDDDPADHGGRTSRGVTQREYSAWRLERRLAPKDVWTASNAEVAQIYHDEYWEPYCDSFPKGIDYLYFDMAVNAGPHRAAVLLQRALGVADDGRIGPITRTAIKMANRNALIDKFTQQKKAYYLSLHQPRFTRGWLNRANAVERDALGMLA